MIISRIVYTVFFYVMEVITYIVVMEDMYDYKGMLLYKRLYDILYFYKNNKFYLKLYAGVVNLKPF